MLLALKKKENAFYMKAIITALLMACCFLAQASDLSQKLQSSDYVLFMRHALAPGVGDPANYSLEDCKTQRNLNAVGRSPSCFCRRVA